MIALSTMNARTLDTILRPLAVAAVMLVLALCAGCARLSRIPVPERFELRVLALNNHPIAGASVTVISPDTAFRAEARYDTLRGLYYLERLPVEQFIVTIAHHGYDTLSRNMWLARIGRPATIYLDHDTVAYTYRLGRKVEYRPQRQDIGVVVDREYRADVIDLIEDGSIPGIRVMQREQILLFQKDDDFDRFNSPELELLRSCRYVRSAGSMFREEEAKGGFLSGEIVVQFETNTTLKARAQLLEKYGLTFVRDTYGPAMIIVKGGQGIGDGINDIVIRLGEEEGVILTEPVTMLYKSNYIDR